MMPLKDFLINSEFNNSVRSALTSLNWEAVRFRFRGPTSCNLTSESDTRTTRTWLDPELATAGIARWNAKDERLSAQQTSLRDEGNFNEPPFQSGLCTVFAGLTEERARETYLFIRGRVAHAQQAG